MVPGIAWIAEQRPLPMLRWLAAALAVLVLARVGWEPRIVGADVGTTPIFNWMLYGYGVPALAFWVAGHLLRKRADDQPSRMVDSAAILFTVLTAFLEIRHFMNDGDIYRPARPPRRTRAAGLRRPCHGDRARARAPPHQQRRARRGRAAHRRRSRFAASCSACWIAVQSDDHRRAGRRRVLQSDPARLRHSGGAGDRAGDAHARPCGRNAYRVVAASIAVLLMLSYLTLEVRTLYHGPVLTQRPDHRRRAIHLFGGLARLRRGAAAVRHLLNARSRRGLPPRRSCCSPSPRCSCVDMAGLTGVFRALSFIGLGLVLVGIGWLYQRLLFPRSRQNKSAPGPTGAPP